MTDLTCIAIALAPAAALAVPFLKLGWDEWHDMPAQRSEFQELARRLCAAIEATRPAIQALALPLATRAALLSCGSRTRTMVGRYDSLFADIQTTQDEMVAWTRATAARRFAFSGWWASRTRSLQAQVAMDATSGLGGKSKQLRKLSRRLNNAHAAMQRSAREDFTDADLQRMRCELDACGAPRSWLRHHPLEVYPDRCWARLDAIRTTDPVVYLDELAAAIALDDGLEQTIARVCAHTAAVRAAEQAPMAPLDHDPHGRIAAREASAADALARFRAALQQGEGEPNLAVAAHDATTALETARRLRQRAYDGPQTAPAAVAAMQQAVDEATRALYEHAAQASATAEALAARYQQLIRKELNDTGDVMDRVHAGAKRAHRCVAEHDWLGAFEAIDAVNHQLVALHSERRDIDACIKSIFDSRKKAAQALSQLAERQEATERAAVRYGGSLPKWLRRSRAQLEHLRTLSADPSQDWTSIAAAVAEVHVVQRHIESRAATYDAPVHHSSSSTGSHYDSLRASDSPWPDVTPSQHGASSDHHPSSDHSGWSHHGHTSHHDSGSAWDAHHSAGGSWDDHHSASGSTDSTGGSWHATGSSHGD